jgi:hypothetical protein
MQHGEVKLSQEDILSEFPPSGSFWVWTVFLKSVLEQLLVPIRQLQLEQECAIGTTFVAIVALRSVYLEIIDSESCPSEDIRAGARAALEKLDEQMRKHSAAFKLAALAYYLDLRGFLPHSDDRDPDGNRKWMLVWMESARLMLDFFAERYDAEQTLEPEMPQIERNAEQVYREHLPGAFRQQTPRRSRMSAVEQFRAAFADKTRAVFAGETDNIKYRTLSGGRFGCSSRCGCLLAIVRRSSVSGSLVGLVRFSACIARAFPLDTLKYWRLRAGMRGVCVRRLTFCFDTLQRRRLPARAAELARSMRFA